MKWINVNNEQPPKDKAFLIYVVGGQIDICAWFNERECFIDYYYHQKCDSIITHWMSLPEPPK